MIAGWRPVQVLSLGIALLVTLTAACGGDDNTDSDGGSTTAPPPAAVAPPPPPAAQASATPGRPVVLTQAMFASIGIDQNEVTGLFGSTPFMQTRSNVTDIPSAFSSSPALGMFLTGQNVQGSYNAWQATAQCTVCAVQVPVMIFPNEAAASAAYVQIVQVNQSIFQNVTPVAGMSAYWDSSFCQTGTFTSNNQTLNWLFCAMRKGNAIITMAVGGFNFDANAIGNSVRRYGARAETFLQSQFR
jgi:hypothetical protein